MFVEGLQRDGRDKEEKYRMAVPERTAKVKICGLTAPGEADWLKEAGADFAGMVLFFPKSRRNITLEQAGAIIEALGDGIEKVAVVVAPTAEQIVKLQKLDFDYVQIHGEIREGVMEALRIPFLKAFNGEETGWEKYRDCEKCAGYVFDASEPGSGKAFDWMRLQEIPRDGKLFILAGGLNPGNVREAVRQVHPDVVDVSSGVEYDSKKGKDPAKIREFISQLSCQEG